MVPSLRGFRRPALLAALGVRGLACAGMDSADRQPPTLLMKTAQPGSVPGAMILDADVRRHLRALRLRSGDTVRITDGRGSMWEGRLADPGGETRDPSCQLEKVLPAEPLLPIVLGFGVGAKTRTLWLVEKAVELGVGALQPVEFARSASVADAARSPSFWKKARRRAEAALEQSGGAWLPELRDPVSLTAFLDVEAASFGIGGGQARAERLMLTAGADVELSDALAGRTDWNGRNPLLLLVGPEGGVEPEEMRASLDNGFRPVGLGSRTLRFETAAIAAVAVVSQHAAARRQTHDKREEPRDE